VGLAFSSALDSPTPAAIPPVNVSVRANGNRSPASPPILDRSPRAIPEKVPPRESADWLAPMPIPLIVAPRGDGTRFGGACWIGCAKEAVRLPA
jgi:hypothetical protein